MNDELRKSLVDLIEESLAEIDELKKSDRFSASEVSIGDSDSGMKGKDKNGSLGKEDAEKADKEEEKEEDDKDKEDKEDEMDKADGKNSEADPNAGHHKMAKEEAAKMDSQTGMPEGTAAKAEDCDDEMDKADGKNSEADPNAGHHKGAAESMSKSEDEEVSLEEELKKSREESETLIKSYIDDKVGGLEAKLAGIADLVKEIADSPVPSKGSSYKNVTPLKKSEDEESAEPLSKSDVADKLFELKKSGETVDSADIATVEVGSPNELSKIITKYNIK